MRKRKPPQTTHAFATDDGVPRTTTSVVAYFDVLGFTKQVQSAARRKATRELLGRFSSTLNDWCEFTRDTFSENLGHQRGWELKAFSDSVVVGYPIRDGGESELGLAITSLARLQLGFILDGQFVVRGAIAVGDLYMDEDIVFGTGLLNAVTDEKKAAGGAPRVLLHRSATDYAREQIQHYASTGRAPHSRWLLGDEDGRIFINYLSGTWDEDTEPPCYDALAQHHDIVAEQLAKHRRNPGVWAKYAWVARYHNYFCGTVPDGAEYVLRVELPSLRARQLDQLFRSRRTSR